MPPRRPDLERFAISTERLLRKYPLRVEQLAARLGCSKCTANSLVHRCRAVYGDRLERVRDEDGTVRYRIREEAT